MPNYSIFNRSAESLKFQNYAMSESGLLVPTRSSFEGLLEVQTILAPFNEVINNERSRLIELKSNYGISALRDLVTTANGGTVTNNGTEYQVSTSSSQTSSSAILDSAERGRYFPGSAGEAGIGMRLPTTPTGQQVARWGYFDDNNGFFFGKDATNLYVAVRRSGTDTTINQSAWNADKLDGSGPSGITIDLTKGNIFQIVYTWYGYGTIEFRVVIQNENNVQTVITVHRYRPQGETSVADPNLPIRAETRNNGTAASLSLFVGGRQYSVIGKYDPNFRITSQTRTGVSIGTGSYTPTVSFQRKTTFPSGTSRANSTSIKIEGFDIISTVDAIVAIRLGSTLTGASFGTPTNTQASETGLQTDISATAINVSTGNLLYSGLVSGGTFFSQQTATQTDLEIELPGSQIVTVALLGLSSSGTASVAFRMREEW